MSIFLATFSLKIINRRKDLQTIERFNGADDFFLLAQRFLLEIFQDRFQLPAIGNAVPLHLTLEEPPQVDGGTREIYGYFKSGISGDNFEIVDLVENQKVMDVGDNHAAYRRMFFYFRFPRGSNRVGVILEKRSKFGIKGLLDTAINAFFQRLGYLDYKIVLDNALPGRFYNEFMEHGRLTKIEIVRRMLPANIEDWYDNEQTPREIKGSIRTVMTSKAGLPDVYKTFIDARYRNPDGFMVEAHERNDVGSIEFTVKLRGKSKKFYIENHDRAQPDIDVTADLIFRDGRATTESLLIQARELIDDILNLRPLNNAG